MIGQGVGNVGVGQVNLHQQQLNTADQTLTTAQTKVANRGLGDKIVAWLRNKGVVTSQSPTMQNVRNAITTKVGADSAQAIFDHLKMGPNKSLTGQQITAAINLANRVQAGQQTPIGQAFLNMPAPDQTTTPAPRFAVSLIGVEKAMAASGVDRGNLTDAELVSIFDYSADGFTHVNNQLRTGNPDANVQAYRTTLNGALAKLPDHQGDVYRCVTLPGNVLSNYTAGAQVTELGYSSTSRAEGEAGNFRSDHRMFIHSSHGKDISGFSRSPSEQEVLFPAGAQFTILSRQDEPDYMGGTPKCRLVMQD
jgi:hypothetical protein